MNASRSGYGALLTVVALGVAAACGKDPVSRSSDDGAEGRAPSASSSSSGTSSNGSGESRKIAVLDDCDPNDPTWAPSGGCALKRGDVTNAEFGLLLRSPLSPTTVVGHPAWRNEPSYLSIEEGQDVTAANEGGRVHTFTEVAQFGGGRVPPLSVGLVPAPECATATNLPPGERIRLSDLPLGIHRFQCCIHPWMRGLIKVTAADHGH